MIHQISKHTITYNKVYSVFPFCFRHLLEKPGMSLHETMEDVIKCHNRVIGVSLHIKTKYPLTKW